MDREARRGRRAADSAAAATFGGHDNIEEEARDGRLLLDEGGGEQAGTGDRGAQLGDEGEVGRGGGGRGMLLADGSLHVEEGPAVEEEAAKAGVGGDAGDGGAGEEGALKEADGVGGLIGADGGWTGEVNGVVVAAAFDARTAYSARVGVPEGVGARRGFAKVAVFTFFVAKALGVGREGLCCQSHGH